MFIGFRVATTGLKGCYLCGRGHAVLSVKAFGGAKFYVASNSVPKMGMNFTVKEAKYERDNCTLQRKKQKRLHTYRSTIRLLRLALVRIAKTFS